MGPRPAIGHLASWGEFGECPSSKTLCWCGSAGDPCCGVFRSAIGHLVEGAPAARFFLVGVVKSSESPQIIDFDAFFHFHPPLFRNFLDPPLFCILGGVGGPFNFYFLGGSSAKSRLDPPTLYLAGLQQKGCFLYYFFFVFIFVYNI